MMSENIGSSFDDFLEEEEIKEEVTTIALKRVISWQLSEAMETQKITKTEMASRMKTSRSVVNRLLDKNDSSVTLATLAKASLAVGVPLRIEFAPNG